MTDSWIWFALRLVAIIPVFGVIGMLIALNLDLWRSRAFLPPLPPPIPWWAAPAISVKLVALNLWVSQDMLEAPETVYSPPTWRLFGMLVLGSIGVPALRAFNRWVDSHLVYARHQYALRRELER